MSRWGGARPPKDRTDEAAMKTIELTAEQKKEIERRRKGTLDRRGYQRLTAIPGGRCGQDQRRGRRVAGRRSYPVGRMAPGLSQRRARRPLRDPQPRRPRQTYP